jgi:hypothetical protein
LRSYLLLVNAISLLLACLAAGAAEGEKKTQGAPAAAPQAARTAPVIHGVYVQVAPSIDGKLDEACWSQASRLEGFFCPNVDSPPPDETIGLICLDEKALYVGFICNDKTPNDIVARETKRNGDIGSDDFVLVAVDPWHKHTDFYQFAVNAAGTQFETIPGGSATKIEWRGDWSGAATRTAAGWQAEMAIPYSILRYPAGQTTFGLAIARQFAQERIMSVYPNTGRSVDPTLFLDLVGLRLPGSVSRPVVMSYLTVDTAALAGGYKTGVDVQYKLPNGLTALGAANPDFTQIEDTVEPISFSYTERYRPDLRPFFVTGEDGFLPREHLLYTRRIEQFDAGAKLFGTVGDETIGLLDAMTYGEQNALAASWRHRFDDNTAAKLLLVSDTRMGPIGDEPGGLAYGLDASHTWRNPRGEDQIWAVAYQSRERASSTGGAYSVGGYHDWGSGNINYYWQTRYATDDFKPSLGYYPDIDNAGASFSTWRWDRCPSGPIETRSWNVDTSYYRFLEEEGVYEARVSPGYYWGWRNGRAFRLGFTRGRQLNFDSSDVNAYYAWNEKDMYRRGSVSLLKGKRAGGDYSYLSVDQGFRATGRMSLRLGVEYGSLVDAPEDSGRYYQGVVTSSYDITSEKTIAARLIARNAGFSAYAAYRQVVRRGVDAYVILGDPDPERTGFSPRVAFKLIRTM